MPTDTLYLRAVEISDMAAVKRWENDESAWDYSDTVAPLSSRIVEEYIACYTADPFTHGELRLVIAEGSGEAVGLVDLYRISVLHAHGFIGIYIDAEKRRQGIGRRSLEMTCRYARERLGLRTLAALILPDNAASIKLFRACGFRQSGRLPAWRRTVTGFSDVLIFVSE